MSTTGGSEIFHALTQALESAETMEWSDRKLYEKTLTIFGVSIAKIAKDEKEKIRVVNILHNMIDKIGDPYDKTSIIQHLGFQRHYAVQSVHKLLDVLKETDHDHVKKYTISALGDIKAIEALDEIKPYVVDEDCYLVKHSVEAIHAIDPEGFPVFFRERGMTEMKTRFEHCDSAFIWTLENLGVAAKEMQPFLMDKYQTMDEDDWRKDGLKRILDSMEQKTEIK